MLGYRINRALQPFNVVVGFIGVTVCSYIVVMAMSGGIEVTRAILLMAAAGALVYVVRAMAYLVSPYKLRISDDCVSFPARVSAETYRWWRAHLPNAAVRYFVSQEFEGSLSHKGFTGTLRLPHVTPTVVAISQVDIASVHLRNRGLSSVELTILGRLGAEPFVCNAQAGVWPFSRRDRLVDTIRRICPDSL